MKNVLNALLSAIDGILMLVSIVLVILFTSMLVGVGWQLGKILISG